MCHHFIIYVILAKNINMYSTVTIRKPKPMKTSNEMYQELIDVKRAKIENIKSGMKATGEASYYYSEIDRLSYEIEFIERELITVEKEAQKQVEAPEEIVDEKLYILYMDRNKNFELSEKVFFGDNRKDTLERASKWGRQFVHNFNEDMINDKSKLTK